MSRFGIDYAWHNPGHPSVAALKAAGVTFCVRYVSYSHDSKNMDPGEVATLRAGGIDVVTNFESTADFMLGGYSAGQTIARDAWAKAKACGHPDGRPIYFSTDFDPDSAQTAACLAFLDGASSVIGKDQVGVYGGRTVIFAAAAAGYRWLWQTYAWTYGVWHPARTLEQYSNSHVIDGTDCDYDHALTDDFGQWDYQGQGADLTPDESAMLKQIAADLTAVKTTVGTLSTLEGEDLTRTKHIEGMVPAAAQEAAARDAVEQALLKALPSGVTSNVDTAAVAALVVQAIGSKLAQQGNAPVTPSSA